MEGHTAGLDWAKEEHAVCVVDAQGNVRASFTVAHSGEGLAELARRLRRYPGVAVAIERPDGLLVDTLLAAGFRVVPIHPKVLQSVRGRYSTTGAKSDPGDAYILADLLRTDGHRFAPLAPQSEQTRVVQALVRTRDDLLKARNALTNQLRSQLEAFWPGAATLFRHLDSKIALAFLTRYPAPEAASRLGEKRLAAFLRGEGYSGKKPAQVLLAKLHAAAQGRVGPAESAARGACVKALVRALEVLLLQMDELERTIAAALGQHPDAAIFQSFPYAGEVNAAQLLAAIGDVRERYPSDDALAAESGAAPVTKKSGKLLAVHFRWACNKRLRAAITTWAGNTRHASPWAADIYKRARARGADHPHAVRILARAWIRVLWRCWQDRVPYDPAKHRAAAMRLAA